LYIPVHYTSYGKVCPGTLGRSCSIDFLPDAKQFSGVKKSAFAEVLGKAAQSRT